MSATPAPAPGRRPDLVSLEGEAGYDIVHPWHRGPMTRGTTAVLRVRNEARSLPFALPALLRICEAVVLVDNASDDETVEVATATAERLGLREKLSVHSYPFRVSRCGPEHLATPAGSIHSLVYFYDWSFSHVRTTYSLKWDGDMVLTRDAEEIMASLAWQLPLRRFRLFLPRHSLYLESDRVAYLDLGLVNVEPYGFPMGPDFCHAKAFEWEIRMFPDDVKQIPLPEGSSVELKWLDSDEFGHWTSPDAFAGSVRTTRKRREYALFQQIAAGRFEDVPDLHRIEAPEGVHVVDHVTQVWLPRRPRPLADPATVVRSRAQ